VVSTAIHPRLDAAARLRTLGSKYLSLREDTGGGASAAGENLFMPQWAQARKW
jgi:hypothetical protein